MTTPKSEDTRDRLIAAATKLFAQRGYDGTSVKELADEAGVNVSLISYHFGGKENLYRTCLEQFGKARLAVAQRVLQPPQSLEEFRFRLKMFIEEMFLCHVEESERAQIIHRECDMDIPIAQDIFRDTFLKVFETLVEFLRSAQGNGVVRPELDPMIITSLLFGSIVHTTRMDGLGEKFFGKTIRNESWRNQVVEHIVQYALFGVAGPHPAPTAHGPERSPK